MEDNSEGESLKQPNKNAVNGNEGQSKPKRQMKTPFQLETLEKAYASETYPSEATRAELSEKLGLSDRQLQMWFCHRRLKDKKENSAKKQPKDGPLSESPVEDMRAAVGPETGSDYGSGSVSGSSPFVEPRKAVLDDGPVMRRYYESSPQSIMELRAIACVEAQLGEPLREDGPILGMQFDPLPPDAFGAPIEMTEQRQRVGYAYESKVYERHDAKPSKASARALHEYQFLPEQSSIRSDAYGQIARSPYGDPSVDTLRGRASPFVHGDEPLPRNHGMPGQMSRGRHLSQQDKKKHLLSSPHRDDNDPFPRDSFTSNRKSVQPISSPLSGPDTADIFPNVQIFQEDTDLWMEKKLKSDEVRISREVEANENRIRKELEKQDNLRRKSEERMKKEMEKQDRERRKEEERLMRERQREEERSMREQKRELERREKFLQKEYIRAEKRRQKEELRREREAVKRKAAIEKAAARKIAKDSLDLLEDEQLELMELAASSKGLTSIVNLDYDTLQNLESFRDSLSIFPPQSIQLKKPFAIRPWMDSEEHIGNLLMVWRFFITFADVLGLWPFTLNEFVQAFHDYDSRLLGEIHVSLLKLIIKDIEDVVRTPSTGLGTNQYCVANPEGGHPQIVEGAYMWGFDIRDWQQHLNPLTWPEIFRQLALSAGFGPRLKKRSAAWTYLNDNDKIKGCQDIISTLRNGSAAENAFALMREKGLLLPRRSRHRLTPGTVKFAAFHVLSLEGSKGLTVLELADKIQKSGLRDLTTSKTPEASISVALTRDQKLFERIAPSTYCVRAAYRKDPADAETVLASARKKIRIFENGFLGGDVDDVEREDDSEDEVDEDPEVDDLATPLTINKSADHSADMNTYSESTKDDLCTDVLLIAKSESEKELVSLPLNGPNDAKTSTMEQCVALEDAGTSNVGQEEIEIDESKTGESWVQGLSEGEYSHLSVEERLNALVALVGIANEGNSIRAVLEDCLEAANALKKQMWAEAQLDRSRLKEDIISKLDFSSLIGGKTETQVGSAVETSQSPLHLVDRKSKEESPGTVEGQKPMFASGSAQNHFNNVPNERTLVAQDVSTNPDNVCTQQHGYASKRSRSQLKAYIAHIAEQVYVYRSLPLGQDRRRNRYWQFVASASRNDPCSGKIFVELREGNWRVIDSEEAFDALLSSLDVRGVRESHLRLMMQKIETTFKENVRRSVLSGNVACQSGIALETEAGVDSPGSVVCGSTSNTSGTCSLFKIEIGRNEMEKMGALRRYQDFQKWMWKECFNPLILCAMKYGKKRCTQLLATCDSCLKSYSSEDAHCLSCHQTFTSASENFNFAEHAMQCEEKEELYASDFSLPLGIKLLKALLVLIEASIPPEALESFWMDNHRTAWGTKMVMSSSAEELLQLLTVLESVVKRDNLSSSFELTKELLGPTAFSASTEDYISELELVPVLPWIPKTYAAVALRLFELDSSIVYILREKKAQSSENKSIKIHMKVPSRYSPLKNKDAELKEIKQDEQYENFDLRNRRNNYKRGRGGRDQGYVPRWQTKVPGSKSDTSRRSDKEFENLNQALRQQGPRTSVQSTGRGRRTVRKRRAEKMVVEDTLFSRTAHTLGPKTNRSLRSFGAEEWGVKKVRTDLDVADNSNSVEAAESDDNRETEGYEQANWEQGFDAGSNGWNENSVGVSDEDGDASGDDNAVDNMEDEDSGGDIEMSDGSDVVANKLHNDEDTDSSDSEYYSD